MKKSNSKISFGEMALAVFAIVALIISTKNWALLGLITLLSVPLCYTRTVIDDLTAIGNVLFDLLGRGPGHGGSLVHIVACSYAIMSATF
ncbi:hypothetical protein ABTK29_18305, partial [Acinetobacter baumannii]